MVSEKECKLGTEEKFFKEEEIAVERKSLFNKKFFGLMGNVIKEIQA